AHPHHRGSHRIPASPQKGHHPPARTSQRHAHFRPGPARCPSPGSQSHPGRRNARSRNHGNRPRSLGNRSPGSFHLAHHRRRQVGRAHHRGLSHGGPAGYPHPPIQGFPLHPFAAPASPHGRQGPYRRHRNPEVHYAYPRIHRKRRVRGQEL